jgi:hypothetical protein
MAFLILKILTNKSTKVPGKRTAMCNKFINVGNAVTVNFHYILRDHILWSIFHKFDYEYCAVTCRYTDRQRVWMPTSEEEIKCIIESQRNFYLAYIFQVFWRIKNYVYSGGSPKTRNFEYSSVQENILCVKFHVVRRTERESKTRFLDCF